MWKWSYIDMKYMVGEKYQYAYLGLGAEDSQDLSQQNLLFQILIFFILLAFNLTF